MKLITNIDIGLDPYYPLPTHQLTTNSRKVGNIGMKLAMLPLSYKNKRILGTRDPSLILTGCPFGAVQKYLLTSLAIMQPMSLVRCHVAR